MRFLSQGIFFRVGRGAACSRLPFPTSKRSPFFFVTQPVMSASSALASPTCLFVHPGRKTHAGHVIQVGAEKYLHSFMRRTVHQSASSRPYKRIKHELFFKSPRSKRTRICEHPKNDFRRPELSTISCETALDLYRSPIYPPSLHLVTTYGVALLQYTFGCPTFPPLSAVSPSPLQFSMVYLSPTNGVSSLVETNVRGCHRSPTRRIAKSSMSRSATAN